MKILFKWSLILFSLLALISCITVAPSYSSSAPEERGERAILSTVKLEGEIQIGLEYLGIFSSHEKYVGGIKENILFVLKGNGLMLNEIIGSKGIGQYRFDNVGSITIDQATKLILALNDYLSKSKTEFDNNQLYNFELITGVIDTESKSEWKRFKEITFIINYSITNKNKTFRTIFSGIKGYQYYELKDEQVLALKNIIENIVNTKQIVIREDNA
jgi:hypothetical protein